MWSPFALFTLLLCLPLKRASLESVEVNTEGPQRVSPNITRLIYDEVLSKVALSQNFLIAPLQVQRILQTYQTHGTTTTAFRFIEELQREADSLPDSHLLVSNKLLKDLNELRKAHKTLNATGELVVNEVSLKAGWQINFHRRDSHKHMFHSKQHRNLYTETMRKDDVFPYAVLEEANAKVVQLSLQNCNYKISFILPNEVDGLSEVVQYFRDESSAFEDILRTRMRHTLVRVILPKFEVINHVVVNQLFEKLLGADDEAPKTTIVQTTRITVTEDGIGEFDNKKVLFWNAFSSARITPEIFDISHPFLFIISDEEHVQLVGVVNEIA